MTIKQRSFWNRFATETASVLHLTSMAVIMLFACMLGVRAVERTWFPPVVEFTVTNISPTDTGYTMAGTLRKVRDCSFEGLSIFAVAVDGDEPGLRLPVQAANTEQPDNDKTRPLGYQRWGYWKIFVPDDTEVRRIAVYVRHSCHALWDQTTELATVDTPPRK